MNYIDLHTHSSYSDGTLCPSAIVDAASEKKISTLSITDHDTMAATAEAIDCCKKCGVEYLPGVEISTHIKTMSVHILGYYLDHNSDPLLSFLETIQQARTERNEKIFLRLNRLGIKLSLSDISNSHNPSSQIGRPHIAQLLVNKRVVKSERDAFSRYLKKNAAAYVQRAQMPTATAIAAIRAAGGIAVLAHPASLGLSEKSLAQLIDQLKEDGLTGVEIFHPLQSDKNIAFLEKLCHKNDLVTTGGSDFHGRDRDKTNIGEYGYNKLISGSLITALNRY
nr:PHP domain-containing protein [Desulfobulbaceae bacterium]